jgi:hypothetical protein
LAVAAGEGSYYQPVSLGSTVTGFADSTVMGSGPVLRHVYRSMLELTTFGHLTLEVGRRSVPALWGVVLRGCAGFKRRSYKFN